MYTDMQREEGAEAEKNFQTKIHRSATEMPFMGAAAAGPNFGAGAAESDGEFGAGSSQMHRSKSQLASMPKGGCIPVCGTPRSSMAAFELLSTLTLGSPANLNLLVDLLTEMFYEGTYPGYRLSTRY